MTDWTHNFNARGVKVDQLPYVPQVGLINQISMLKTNLLIYRDRLHSFVFREQASSVLKPLEARPIANMFGQ
jgi:hypothetical protein